MSVNNNPEKRVNESQSLNDMVGRGDNFKLLAVIGIGFAPQKDEDPLPFPEAAWYDPEYEKKHLERAIIEDIEKDFPV